MAIYIPILKSEEDTEAVLYEFGNAERILGSVLLDKASGSVQLVAIDEKHSSEFYVSRIRRVLTRHHEAGTYPAETCYRA